MVLAFILASLAVPVALRVGFRWGRRVAGREVRAAWAAQMLESGYGLDDRLREQDPTELFIADLDRALEEEEAARNRAAKEEEWARLERAARRGQADPVA